jgi:hypothetical protein
MPIAEIYVDLSAPCGDVTQNYGERTNALKDVYMEGSCSFDMDDVKVHPDYLYTGFQESEQDIYKDNGLYSKVADHVPNFKQEELI